MAAANAALATIELLEMILLAPGALTMVDLLHCRQVCHEWHRTIDDSIRLQQRLHLSPEAASFSVVPTLLDTFPPYVINNTSFDHRLTRMESSEQLTVIRLDFSPADLLSRNNSEPDNLLLLQPPHQIRRFRVAAFYGYTMRPLTEYSPDTAGSIATLGAFVDAAKAHCVPRGERIRVAAIVDPVSREREIDGSAAAASRISKGETTMDDRSGSGTEYW